MIMERERKTRQTTVLFRPSVYDNFKRIAYVQRISTNSLLDNIMEDYVNAHKDLLLEYKRLESEQ